MTGARSRPPNDVPAGRPDRHPAHASSDATLGRVLILSASAGAGHIRAGQALERTLVAGLALARRELGALVAAGVLRRTGRGRAVRYVRA